MAEYIEREAAVKVAEKYGLANGSALGRHTGLADCIASEIADIPTADVAPVIHCKDCTFGHYIDYGHMHCLHPCGLTTNMINDFCSYAERKEPNDEQMD